MKRLVLVASIALTLAAETADPRLPVHTVVREDIFSGFMAGDMARFERGVATIEQLDRERPNERQNVRVWQGSVALFRAVQAYEKGDKAEGHRLYALALDRWQEAVKLAPADPGVQIVLGASSAYFADRLPAEERAASWARAYDAYQGVAKMQMPAVAQLPSHLQGELLAGLAMTAQRTGRDEEFRKMLDKMIEVAGSTPYGRAAVAWKERPEIMAKTTLMCKNCHEPGRLEARKAELSK
jgi:hypothetical protein